MIRFLLDGFFWSGRTKRGRFALASLLSLFATISLLVTKELINVPPALVFMALTGVVAWRIGYVLRWLATWLGLSRSYSDAELYPDDHVIFREIRKDRATCAF